MLLVGRNTTHIRKSLFPKNKKKIVGSDMSSMEHVHIVKDVVYDTETQNTLDVYIPPPTVRPVGTPMMACMYIHGGAWSVGHKDSAISPCVPMARQGLLMVAPSYRQTPLSDYTFIPLLLIIILICILFLATSTSRDEWIIITGTGAFVMLLLNSWWIYQHHHENHQHPAHIEDVSRAFLWMYEHIAEYGGSPDRLFVMGHSAGAHLATLLTTQVKEKLGSIPLAYPIKACIALSGVYDDAVFRKTLMGRHLLREVFGESIANDENDNVDFSTKPFPVYHIHQDLPPFLLINSGFDIGLKWHTESLVQQLRTHHVYYDYIEAEELSHFNMTKQWDRGQRNEKYHNYIRRFLQQATTHWEEWEAQHARRESAPFSSLHHENEKKDTSCSHKKTSLSSV